MDIEIPILLYELLLKKAAETDSSVEEIAEFAFKNIWKGMRTLLDNEKKGITVKIDAGLHAEVKQYLESHGMTMAEFVTQALQDELHPKINMQEEKNMGNMKTIAFQVPEELFQRIKDYLQNNNMTQKEFMLGFIENELNRDLTQRAEVTEAPLSSASSLKPIS